MEKQYKNPPITEVVCEFRLELEDNFDQKAVDSFFDGIKDKFPKRKKGQVHQMKFESNPKEQTFNKTVQEFDQFFSEDEKIFVQLDKGRLSIHKLKPYNSWQEFYPLIALIFNAYIKNIKIKFIQRIGLRYINNLEIPLSSFDIEQYFNLRPSLGEGLPQDLASFMIGAIFVLENQRDNIKVQLFDKPMTEPDKIMFVLDMDYFLPNPGTVDVGEAIRWVENAHKNTEEIFEAILTDKTKQLFD